MPRVSGVTPILRKVAVRTVGGRGWAWGYGAFEERVEGVGEAAGIVAGAGLGVLYVPHVCKGPVLAVKPGRARFGHTAAVSCAIRAHQRRPPRYLFPAVRAAGALKSSVPGRAVRQLGDEVAWIR
ncbi:hypothetical protein GCM10010392_52630 [Streptomyces clavifer]|nr:hypothetical protein GCM10010392_52630 [Streptomyces clavifer]